MNRTFTAALAATACMTLYLASFDDALAQTGAAATKQMQDTQRAAQKKARAAKGGDTQDQMKGQKESAPAPASDAH